MSNKIQNTISIIFIFYDYYFKNLKFLKKDHDGFQSL
jgi:hypothetical protein